MSTEAPAIKLPDPALKLAVLAKQHYVSNPSASPQECIEVALRELLQQTANPEEDIYAAISGLASLWFAQNRDDPIA